MIHRRGAALSLDTFDILCSIWPASRLAQTSAYVDLQQSACREKFIEFRGKALISLAQYSLDRVDIFCPLLYVQHGGEKGGKGGPTRRMRIIDYQLTSLHAFPPFPTAACARTFL